jgi:hypothetical protein
MDPDKYGSISCTKLCGSGFSTTRQGATSCSLCPIGKTWLQSNDSKSGPTCMDCPHGHFSTKLGNNGSCAICPIGTVCDAMGLSQAVPCPIGTYANQKGSLSCTQCLAGELTPTLGATSQLDCNSPKFNFIVGFFTLFISVCLAWPYLVRARFERVAFFRYIRVSSHLVEEVNSYFVGLFNLYYYFEAPELRRKQRRGQHRKQNTRSSFLTSIYMRLFTFILVGLVIFGSSTVLAIFFHTLSIFFKSLIIWKSFTSSFFNKITDFALFMERVTDSLFSLLYAPWMSAIFIPFMWVFNHLQFLRVELSVVTVSCQGSAAPLEFLTDLLILGVTVIITESEIQIYDSITHLTMLSNYCKTMVTKGYRQYFWDKRMGRADSSSERDNDEEYDQHWSHWENRQTWQLKIYLTLLKYFLIPIQYIITVLTSLLAQSVGRKDIFTYVLSYSVSLLVLSKYMSHNGIHAYSEVCNTIPGYEGVDYVLALLSSILAYVMLPAGVYTISKVLVPGLPHLHVKDTNTKTKIQAAKDLMAQIQLDAQKDKVMNKRESSTEAPDQSATNDDDDVYVTETNLDSLESAIDDIPTPIEEREQEEQEREGEREEEIGESEFVEDPPLASQTLLPFTAIDIVIALQLYPGDLDVISLVEAGYDEVIAREIVRLDHLSQGNVENDNMGDTSTTVNPLHSNDQSDSRDHEDMSVKEVEEEEVEEQEEGDEKGATTSTSSKKIASLRSERSSVLSSKREFTKTFREVTFKSRDRQSVLIEAQDVYNIDKSPQLTVIIHENYKKKISRIFKYVSLFALDLWWCVFSKRVVKRTRQLVPMYAKTKGAARPTKRIEYTISPWKHQHTDEYAKELAEKRARMESKDHKTKKKWYNFNFKFASYLLAPTHHATIEEEKAYLLSKIGRLPSYAKICHDEMGELQSIIINWFKIGHKASVSIYIFSPLIVFGLGHVLTTIGRRIWYIVFLKYIRFFLLCLGCWDDDSVRCFDIHNKIRQYSMHLRTKINKQSEGIMAPDESDEVHVNDENDNTTKESTLERLSTRKSDASSLYDDQGRSTRTSITVPWHDYGPEPVYTRNEEECKQKTLLSPNQLNLHVYEDYFAAIKATVVPRAVLLQAISYFTPLSIFAQCTAMFPLFLHSKSLRDKSNKFYYTIKESIEEAEEGERCEMQYMEYYLKRNEKIKVRRWVIILKSLQIFVGQARIIGFMLGFIEFITIMLLLVVPEVMEPYVLATGLLIEAPRVIISSLQVYIIIGVWLNITDEELSLLTCFPFSSLSSTDTKKDEIHTQKNIEERINNNDMNEVVSPQHTSQMSRIDALYATEEVVSQEEEGYKQNTIDVENDLSSDEINMEIIDKEREIEMNEIIIE